jgi:hypothetical protein
MATIIQFIKPLIRLPLIVLVEDRGLVLKTNLPTIGSRENPRCDRMRIIQSLNTKIGMRRMKKGIEKKIEINGISGNTLTN